MSRPANRQTQTNGRKPPRSAISGHVPYSDAVSLSPCFALLRKPIACLTILLWALAGAQNTVADQMTTHQNSLETAISAGVRSGELKGLHGVLVLQGDKVLAESYFKGTDEAWGSDLGQRAHGPDTLHDIRSVTKSIVSLLYGIALDEGLVPAPRSALMDQFPGFPDLAEDPRRASLTIHHALSMRMGLQWNEALPYSDPRNSEVAMELAGDRYRFVLDRPFAQDPGTAWTYSGGAVALIAHLIERGTGQPLDTFAQRRLFAPLGITAFEWTKGYDGTPSAASGLRLTLRDLAKLGKLVANDGFHNGQQIISSEWLNASTTPISEVPDAPLRYGYFWWLPAEGSRIEWIAGFGNGGQRLVVMPDHGLVVTIHAGLYNDPQDWKLPVRLMDDYIGPAVIPARR